MPSARTSTTSPDIDEMYDHLVARDDVLKAMADRYGRPDPFVWAGHDRAGGSNFAALVLHVVGQQISTLVALVLYGRLEQAAGGRLDPGGVATLGRAELRSLGLSDAKARAIVGLAEMQLSGALDVEQLHDLDDEQATAALTSARGVGP